MDEALGWKKVLLFEKRSKNFCDFRCALRRHQPLKDKSFLGLFSKKNRFLPQAFRATTRI
jgi:hypothetical protein